MDADVERREVLVRRLREVVARTEVELRVAGPVVGDAELEQRGGVASSGRCIELEHGDVGVVFEPGADLERNGPRRIVRGGGTRGRSGLHGGRFARAGVVVAENLPLRGADRGDGASEAYNENR
jgi:hypothetical protein